MPTPTDRKQTLPASHPTCVGLLHEYTAKLVLEVFGGGGAVWGFSEVCGLRTEDPESVRFWRCASITVAILFGVRWFRQLQFRVLSLQCDWRQRDTPFNEKNIISTRNHLSIKSAARNGSTEKCSLTESEENSSFRIQSSSFLFGDNEDMDNSIYLDDDVDVDVSLALTVYTESTALSSSPRSPT